MCEQKEPLWWNNFECSINLVKYEMRNGHLTINDIYYEQDEFEIYALIRAYYSLAILPT